MGGIVYRAGGHAQERSACHFGIDVTARAVLVGVLSVCALPASPSAGPAVVSQLPASTSRAPAPVMLGEIFGRQLKLLDTLQARLDKLRTHNSTLQSSLNESEKALSALRTELQRQIEAYGKLQLTLKESDKASQSLRGSLRSSEGLLSEAQSSLRRAERDKWVMMAAALAAGAILGGLLL